MRGWPDLHILWSCGRRGVFSAIVVPMILVGQPIVVGKANPSFQGRDAVQVARPGTNVSVTSGSVDTRFATGQAGPWPLGHLALNGATASVDHGYYLLSNKNGYSAMAFPKGTASLGDGTITATFQLPTRGKVGVLARYSSIRDVVDYDDCWLDATSHLGCDAWGNGSPRTLLAPRALRLSRTVNHTLALSLHGSALSVSVDGRQAYQGYAAQSLPAGQWGLYVIGKFSQGVVKGSFTRATITDARVILARTPSPTRTPKPTATMRPKLRPTSTPALTSTPRPTGTPSPSITPSPTSTPQPAWTSRVSGTTQSLYDVSCPSANVCVAVGGGGTILASKDGGVNWANVPAGISQTLDGISCPSTSVCVAVGSGVAVLTSNDGGITWISRSSGQGIILNGVSCPSVSICVGANPFQVMTSADGGITWTNRPSGANLRVTGVSCPSISECVAVGYGGALLTSQDGGITWTTQSSGSTGDLGRISCATVSICIAAGASSLLRTADGGRTWTNYIPSNVQYLTGVSCSSASTCVAVYYNTILSSEDSGVTWTSEALDKRSNLLRVSCATASVCVAVGDGGAIVTGGTSG
jgi:photosystem II stability/assembly factor-like uncharacterized protein